MTTAKAEKIGDLNGWWGMWFKLALATYPFLMMWATWVTYETMSNQYFRLSGELFTRSAASQLRSEIKDDMRGEVRMVNESLARLDTRIDSLPPDEWRARIVQVEREVQLLKVSLAEIKSDIKYLVQKTRQTSE